MLVFLAVLGGANDLRSLSGPRPDGEFPPALCGLCAAIICLFRWRLPGSSPAVSPLRAWLVAIAGGIVMVRSIDWLAGRGRGRLMRVWLVLTVWPALQIEDVAVPLPSPKDRIGLVIRRFAAGSSGGGSACPGGAGPETRRPGHGALLDSTWKTLEIYLLAGGANHLLVGSFALAGYRVSDGFRYPILAHSVLDFWSRYNVWIHRWLKRHIFEPIARAATAGAGHPCRLRRSAGLVHEYFSCRSLSICSAGSSGSSSSMGWQRSPVAARPRLSGRRGRCFPRPWPSRPRSASCSLTAPSSSTAWTGSSTSTATWANGCSEKSGKEASCQPRLCHPARVAARVIDRDDRER